MVVGTAVIVAIPFIIYAFRRPSWKSGPTAGPPSVEPAAAPAGPASEAQR